jgi:hypothetical protein
LLVPCGAECECTNRLWQHTVVVLLMGLHIFAKLVLTVLVKVNCLPCDDSPWAQSLGKAKRMRESLELVDAKVNHFNENAAGNFVEW